jgi:hypothetical protein
MAKGEIAPDELQQRSIARLSDYIVHFDELKKRWMDLK